MYKRSGNRWIESSDRGRLKSILMEGVDKELMLYNEGTVDLTLGILAETGVGSQ